MYCTKQYSSPPPQKKTTRQPVVLVVLTNVSWSNKDRLQLYENCRNNITAWNLESVYSSTLISIVVGKGSDITKNSKTISSYEVFRSGINVWRAQEVLPAARVWWSDLGDSISPVITEARLLVNHKLHASYWSAGNMLRPSLWILFQRRRALGERLLSLIYHGDYYSVWLWTLTLSTVLLP